MISMKHKLLFKNLLSSYSESDKSIHEEYQLFIKCNYKSFITIMTVDQDTQNNSKSESLDYNYCPYCGDKLKKEELNEENE